MTASLYDVGSAWKGVPHRRDTLCAAWCFGNRFWYFSSVRRLSLIHLISTRLEGYAGKAGSGCRTARMRAVRLASSFSYTRTYTNLPVFQRYSKTFAKTHTLMLQTPQVHLVPLLSYSASLPGSTITTKRGLFHLIRR